MAGRTGWQGRWVGRLDKMGGGIGGHKQEEKGVSLLDEALWEGMAGRMGWRGGWDGRKDGRFQCSRTLSPLLMGSLLLWCLVSPTGGILSQDPSAQRERLQQALTANSSARIKLVIGHHPVSVLKCGANVISSDSFACLRVWGGGSGVAFCHHPPRRGEGWGKHVVTACPSILHDYVFPTFISTTSPVVARLPLRTTHRLACWCTWWLGA